MRRVRRGVVAAVLLVGLAALAPGAAEAGGTPTPYTCNETSETGLVPEFSAELTVGGSSTPASARIFQPVTWTVDIDEPALSPPLSVNLSYLRVRVAIPDDLTNVSAKLVAAQGETPNPAISAISIQASAGEIVVQLPSNPGNNNAIKAWADDDMTNPHPGSHLTYPSNILTAGNPVVLPRVQVTGTPTPAAGGTTVTWQAPTVESALTVSAQAVTVACTPDGEPDPAVVSTPVSTTRQACDGKPVTVQLGFNAPTGGNDVIQGTPGADTTNGLGGNDRFCGLDGGDTYRGGPGNDRALGGLGNDRLNGDAGDDRLQGDAGNDTINGGAGKDTLLGAAGRDTCIGGPQRDSGIACEVRQSIP